MTTAAQGPLVSRSQRDVEAARAYVSGGLDAAAYLQGALARYESDHPANSGRDPVITYDAMWEAGNSLIGSYVWLADHAADEDEAAAWRLLRAGVIQDRGNVDPRAVRAHEAATSRYLAWEQAVRVLVTV